MRQRLNSYIRRPVKRQGAEQYLLVTLLSFALSITLTRLFLVLTGYPQLGGGELHIAHALWGGLLLFIAALLPLVYANRWVYMAGAVLAGTGVGLFIDEVGKFITQQNDYFYPLAAPIVYAFFLLTVMLYLRIRRPPARSARAELFHAFDAMEEVLEQDLEEHERDELEARLRYVAEHGDRADLKQLAEDLLEFLRCETLELAPRRSGVVQKALRYWPPIETRWVSRERSRLLLVAALAALGLFTLARTGVALNLVSAVYSAMAANNAGAPPPVSGGLLASLRYAIAHGLFRYIDLGLEAGVSLLLLWSAVLLAAGKDHLGTAFGSLGLLLSLTAVNLMVFYYAQFAGIITALVQLSLLVAIAYYRQRYLSAGGKPAAKTAKADGTSHEAR